MLNSGKRTRDELIRRVGRELGRELSAQSVFMHEAAAQRLGLNATHTRCLDLIGRNDKSQMTAGDLSRASGLTTGAITGILDRLEAVGFVERVRDPSDRRKVLIRPTPLAADKVGALYESLGQAMLQLVSSYRTEELELIDDFLERNLTVLREQMEIEGRS